VENVQAKPIRSPVVPAQAHKLSSLYGRTIYAVDIEADLRAVFYLEGNSIVTVDIGTHDIYKG
jgi:hypothetical protein